MDKYEIENVRSGVCVCVCMRGRHKDTAYKMSRRMNCIEVTHSRMLGKDCINMCQSHFECGGNKSAFLSVGACTNGAAINQQQYIKKAVKLEFKHNLHDENSKRVHIVINMHIQRTFVLEHSCLAASLHNGYSAKMRKRWQK